MGKHKMSNAWGTSAEAQRESILKRVEDRQER